MPNFDKATSQSHTFARLYPCRMYNSGWVLHSGTTYYLDLGSGVYFDSATCKIWDGVNKTDFDDFNTRIEITNYPTLADVLLGAGRYFYDSTLNRIYLRNTNDENPNGKWVVIETELFVGTYGAYVGGKYYEPYLIKPPSFKQSFGNQIFGFLPTESSSIELSNATHWLESLSYDYIFEGARINVYVALLGENQTIKDVDAELHQTIAGQMGSVSIRDNTASIQVRNFIEYLNLPYNRLSVVSSVFSPSNIKIEERQAYIRKIFGYVRGFKPVGITYTTTVSTGTNRNFVVSNDPVSSHPVLSTTVNNAGSSTTEISYVTSAAGFNKGDSIVVQRSGVDRYAFVVDVDYGLNKITHTAVVGAVVNGDIVERGFISGVQIIDDTNTTRFLSYKRDWTETTVSGKACLFLANNFEAVVSGFSGTFHPDNMELTIDVNGVKTVPVTSGALPVGAVNQKSGALCNPVSILFDVLQPTGNPFGVGSAILDESTFDSLADQVSFKVGLAIPEEKLGALPTTKEIAVKLLNSFIGRMFIKSSNPPKLSLSLVAPTKSTPDYTIDKSEIISLNYDLDWNDAPSSITVYGQDPEAVSYFFPGLVAPLLTCTHILGSFESGLDLTFGQFYPYFRRINGHVGRWGTNSKRDYRVDTLTWDTDFSLDPETLAERYFYLIHDRSGKLTITCKNRFFLANIGDTIEVMREALPGFFFVSGTERSKKFIVIEKSYQNNTTVLVLDDQRGIEENSGAW